MKPSTRSVRRRLRPVCLSLFTMLFIGCAPHVPLWIGDDNPVLNNSDTFIVDVVYVEGPDMIRRMRAVDRAAWFVEGCRSDFADVTTSFRVETVGQWSTIERISPPRPHEKSIKLTERGATIEMDIPTKLFEKEPMSVLVSVYADYNRATLAKVGGGDDSCVLRFDPRSETKIAIELGQDGLHLRYQ